jgi:hypothetical protein
MPLVITCMGDKIFLVVVHCHKNYLKNILVRKVSLNVHNTVIMH